MWRRPFWRCMHQRNCTRNNDMLEFSSNIMRRLHSFHSFFSSLFGSAFSFFLSSFVVCMAVHLYTHRRQAFAPASSLKAAFCIFSINLNLDIGQIKKREKTTFKLLTSNQAMLHENVRNLFSPPPQLVSNTQLDSFPYRRISNATYVFFHQAQRSCLCR